MNIEFQDDIALYVVDADQSSLTNWGLKFTFDDFPGSTVRYVRGAKARTYSQLLDEFAAALQFPWYFGENWNAFNDCISDLDWLNCNFCVVVVFDAEQLLIEEELKDFEILTRQLSNARQRRTQGLQSIDDVQKDLPFYVIFQCSVSTKDQLIERLIGVNAKFVAQTLSPSSE